MKVENLSGERFSLLKKFHRNRSRSNLDKQQSLK